MKKIWMALGALFVALGCHAQLELGQLPSEIYKKDPDLKLYFVYPEGKIPDEKLPAIVFFHGGGWRGGSPSAFIRQAEYLAKRGMISVLAEYRLTGKYPDLTLDKCVADAKSAMRYVKIHADRLGIDTCRLAAGGGSAGGHLAAATALVPGFDAPGDDLSISPVPKLLVLFNPVANNAPAPEGYGNSFANDYFPQISPYHNIRKGAPTTLIMVGTKDALIPVSTVEAYADAMKRVGSVCEVEFYEGAGHAFFNYGGESGYYGKTVARMDRFLVENGYLKEKE